MEQVRDVVQAQPVRRALLWAGLLFGAAVLMKGLATTQTWIYLNSLLVVGMVLDIWMIDDPGDSRLAKWVGPIAAALMLIVAAAMRLFIAW